MDKQLESIEEWIKKWGTGLDQEAKDELRKTMENALLAALNAGYTAWLDWKKTEERMGK